jgi:hypothetical protein
VEILPEGIVLYAVVVLAAVGLALGAWFLLHASPLTPEEREQRRRMHVSRVGRATEARIVEIIEIPDANNEKDEKKVGAGGGNIQMLSYRYELRGVEYQASQDVRFYQEQIDLSNVAAGQTASVKYDPKNPVNSIVLAEDWSGL